MRIDTYGHACLLVEDGGTRVLLDPGIYSNGFEGLRDLDAVVLTHSHPDHADVDRLPALLAANPDAQVLSDATTAAQLTERAIARPTVLRPGDTADVGMAIAAVGGLHVPIHPDLGELDNIGVLLGGRLLHPGDSLVVPDDRVEILAVPIGGPWLKLSEAIDYVREVHPSVAIPIHGAGLTRPEMHVGHLKRLGQDDIDWRVPVPGESIEV
ncbi:MBL fold metallo-hydrolase [Agromyces sp. SYSU T00194]|uniref:MBL fold metallo-hydrolase n=1 Tax=Agromyces chitinivorans TaxID=3158560 RepID=UPI003391C3EF